MTELPGGWTIRRPTLDDVPEILKLVHASDIAAVGEPDFTADEVREALTGPNTDMARDCWLALDETGAVVGWAYPDNATSGPREFVEVYVWPERACRPCVRCSSCMLARVAERGRLFGHDPYTVRAGAVRASSRRSTRSPRPGSVPQAARPDDDVAGERVRRPARAARRGHGPPGAQRRRRRDAPVPRDHRGGVPRLRPPGDRLPDLAQRGGGGVQHLVRRVVRGRGGRPGGGGAAVVGRRRRRRRGLGQQSRGAAPVPPARRRCGAVAPGVRHLRRQGPGPVGLGVDLANPTRAARLYHAVGMHPQYQANIYQRTL